MSCLNNRRRQFRQLTINSCYWALKSSHRWRNTWNLPESKTEKSQGGEDGTAPSPCLPGKLTDKHLWGRKLCPHYALGWLLPLSSLLSLFLRFWILTSPYRLPHINLYFHCCFPRIQKKWTMQPHGRAPTGESTIAALMEPDIPNSFPTSSLLGLLCKDTMTVQLQVD